MSRITRAFQSSFKSWFGPVFVFANIMLLIAGVVLPRYLQAGLSGEAIGPGFRRLVGGINYPVFWIYDKISTQGWVATPIDIGVIFCCLLIYWYCQGLLVGFALRIVRERNSGIGD